MEEKLCEERRFGVFKTLKTQELPGALPPGPPPGRCPWTPPGALQRAPGPHAVKTLRSLRSLRSTWTQTIFIQHPVVDKSCTRSCLQIVRCACIANIQRKIRSDCWNTKTAVADLNLFDMLRTFT